MLGKGFEHVGHLLDRPDDEACQKRIVAGDLVALDKFGAVLNQFLDQVQLAGKRSDPHHGTYLLADCARIDVERNARRRIADDAGKLTHRQPRNTSADGVLNTDGVLRYALSGNGGETWSAAQWFRETGEIWSFDTHRCGRRNFYFGSVMGSLIDFARDCLAILSHFGVIGQIRIEVGAVGLLGTMWPGQFAYERSKALLDALDEVR